MKRLLIGVVAIAGLLGSALAIAASVASPASAQTSSVTVQNRTTRDTNLPAAQQQVIVGISTVNNCNPGNRAPLSSSITLNADATNGQNMGAADVTGVLSQNCNWEITFRNGSGNCAVMATVIQADGTTAGSPETDGNLILSGVGGNGPLRYANQDVARIDFRVTTSCSTSFQPAATINLAASTAGRTYTGVSFAISFAPVARSNAACTQSGSLTYSVKASGSITRDGNALNLVNRPLGATADCVYNVTFPAETGALRLARTPAATRTVRASAATATATYDVFTVAVSVVTTFPSDEVFTTQDKVDYFINVIAPCGGYLGVIPQAFGSQGDVASVQVFPGSVTVYGDPLNPILVAERNFTITAFADGAGTRPCTVQVTERNGPDRCTPVGGGVQTRTYSAGTTAFAFEFTHTCTAPVADSGEAGDSATNTTIPSIITPPDPPPIEIPTTPGTTPPSIDPSGPDTGPQRPGITG